MPNIYAEISRNRRTTWVVVLIFVSIFLFIGLGFDYFYGAGFKAPIFSAVAILIALTASYASYAHGDKLILASTHARPLDLGIEKENQWQNVVGEMCIASGIPMPATYVIEDRDPNAFATGRDPKHSSIVVTRGLLDTLNRDELQAVAAHEMSHIKNFDIRLMLMIAVLVGSVALLADWAGRSLFYGRPRRSSSSGSKDSGPAVFIILAVWLVAVILAPILSQMIAMLVSRKREFLADASGAELTRNPIALASALEKIEAKAEPTRSISRGTAHLCIADPKGRSLNSKEGWAANLFATHPPLAKRVTALKEMAYIQ